MEEALQNQQKRNRVSENQRKDEQTEMALQEKDNEITDLKEELSVIKKLHSTQLEENKKSHGEVDTFKSKLKTLGKIKTDLDEKVEALQKELLSTNEALKSQNADPKIAELETMVTEFRKRKEEDDKQITDLKVLLDEAGEDYLAKNREIKGLQSKITSLKVNVVEIEINPVELKLENGNKVNGNRQTFNSMQRQKRFIQFPFDSDFSKGLLYY